MFLGVLEPSRKQPGLWRPSRHKLTSAEYLDKKAQLDHTPKTSPSSSASKRKEKGKPDAQKIIDKRARRKGFGVALASAMVRYAESAGSPMLKTYIHALQCSEVLHQVDGTLQTIHCKTRFCPVCGAVRTAKAVDSYLPAIQTWSPFLVTLTVPNVSGGMLKKTIDEMTDRFRNSMRSVKRKQVFKGVRKLEVTYNREKDSYHPHFHVIVDGKEAALALREAWLGRNDRAGHAGQDVRKCDRNSLKEVFKYSMKVLASDSDKVGDPRLSPAAIDTIVQALWRKRTYQNFGFKLAKEFDEDDFDGVAMEAPSGNAGDGSEWHWHAPVANWVNRETGELLSQYQPSARRMKFLKRVQDSG